MGLLDINMEDNEELKILPDNTEAHLRIARADITPNRTDPSRSNLAITFDIPEDPMVDDIRVWLPIPTFAQKENDPKAFVKATNRIKEFLNAFDLPGQVETEAMLGAEGWAILREDTDLNDNPVNSVRRYVVGK